MSTLNKYEKYDQISDRLIAAGFKKKHLYYQVGGGEDEDGDDVFMKDEIILSWDYISDRWYKGHLDNYNYWKGIPADEVVDINDYI